MATLIYSTTNQDKSTILTYIGETADVAVNDFIDKLFKPRALTASKRLNIKNGRYMYTPSDEYKLIRVKFNK